MSIALAQFKPIHYPISMIPGEIPSVSNLNEIVHQSQQANLPDRKAEDHTQKEQQIIKDRKALNPFDKCLSTIQFGKKMSEYIKKGSLRRMITLYNNHPESIDYVSENGQNLLYSALISLKVNKIAFLIEKKPEFKAAFVPLFLGLFDIISFRADLRPLILELGKDGLIDTNALVAESMVSIYKEDSHDKYKISAPSEKYCVIAKALADAELINITEVHKLINKRFSSTTRYYWKSDMKIVNRNLGLPDNAGLADQTTCHLL